MQFWCDVMLLMMVDSGWALTLTWQTLTPHSRSENVMKAAIPQSRWEQLSTLVIRKYACVYFSVHLSREINTRISVILIRPSHFLHCWMLLQEIVQMMKQIASFTCLLLQQFVRCCNTYLPFHVFCSTLCNTLSVCYSSMCNRSWAKIIWFDWLIWNLLKLWRFFILVPLYQCSDLLTYFLDYLLDLTVPSVWEVI